MICAGTLVRQMRAHLAQLSYDGVGAEFSCMYDKRIIFVCGKYVMYILWTNWRGEVLPIHCQVYATTY
jgi:hypothetical protein